MKLAKLLFWKKPKPVFTQISRFSLYGLIFLLPIFVLPFTQDYLEISKTILLYFALAVSSLAYLLHVLQEQKNQIGFDKISWFIVALVAWSAVSVIFSWNWRLSLVGLAGYYNDSLVTIIFLAALFFLAKEILKDKKQIRQATFLLLIAAGLVMIFSCLQLLGAHIFPQAIAQTKYFNLIGNSVTPFSLFLALAVLGSLSLLISEKGKPAIIFLISLISLSILLLILFDNQVGWFALVVGLFIWLLALAGQTKKISSGWIILPTALIVLSVVFIFVDVNSWTGLNLNNDIVLGQANSWKVAGSTLKSRWLSGSGQNTFHYSLQRFRPDSFNNHPFWSASFIKANSQWAQYLSTLGLPSFLLILFIAALFIIRGIRKIRKSRFSPDWALAVFIFSSWLVIFLSGFLTSYNLLISFLFWLFLALGFSLFPSRQKSVSTIVKKTKGKFAQASFFSFWLVFVVVVLVMAVRIYTSETAVASGRQAVKDLAEITEVKDDFQQAVKFNPFWPDNHFSLAEVYLVETGLNLEEGLTNNTEILKKSAGAINQAVSIAQQSSRAWRRKAALYLDFRNYVQDTEDVVFASWQKAKEYSQRNPLLYYESGQSYLVYAQNYLNDDNSQEQARNYLDKAEAEFFQAIDLKNDFVEAHYLLSQVYELQKNLVSESEQAILLGKIVDQLETILFYDPENQEIIDYLAELKKEASGEVPE